MGPVTWGVIVFLAVVGHFGLHVAIYNRLNGLGLKRKTIKRIERFFMATTVLIPAAVGWFCGLTLWRLISEGGPADSIPSSVAIYGAVCLLTWLAFGVPWLVWRPVLGIEWIKVDREIEVVDVESAVGRPLALSRKCKLECKLPLNQIFDLSIEQITIPVAGLPVGLDGYRIAQFSDVHLTGHIHADFTSYVVKRATDWQPDLMAVSGDIIDALECVDWLYDIFSPAQAPDGCYFILGNHDTRISDPSCTRSELARAGWTDVGPTPVERTLRDVPSLIIGNEAPWFERPEVPPAKDGDKEFRLLLSHSPDQLPWARKHGVHLMLVGHTHGGQGRLPLAGPVLSPSFHGSRYASGDFYKAPTTMHVSRGLSGTHVVRINCRPQLSLLTLKAV